jgi:hypothetical protein
MEYACRLVCLKYNNNCSLSSDTVSEFKIYWYNLSVLPTDLLALDKGL